MRGRVLALLVLVAAPWLVLAAQEHSDRGLTPEVLYWRDSDGKPLRATGLLYRPELLSTLVAARPAETVPVRISAAVKEQTAIVVMWMIPERREEPAVGPSHLLIRDTRTGNFVAPIWETKDAGDLRLVDPRTPFHNVGAVAAFPLSAFQPGRIAVIYAPLPDNPATGGHRSMQVFGEFRETRLHGK